LTGVSYDVVPALSSLCDLYALGVLAVRTLLVDAQTSLPKALDEAMSLNREAGAAGDADRLLWQRIAELFENARARRVPWAPTG